MKISIFARFAIFLALTALCVWAAPPDPVADPGPDANIFYGSVPPGGSQSQLIVFIHGLKGRASDWWINNDMYQFAYNAGYRTAFISASLDNSQNDSSIAANSAVLKAALPKIAARYSVSKFYLVCHSKGGLDAQSAMLDPAISGLVKGVFNISTPNTGTELADWAFGPGQSAAGALGLLTPAVSDLRTANVAAFRATADPVLSQLGIRFYTFGGTVSTGNPITAVTGAILTNLVPGVNNDGFVPLSRTTLPASYGVVLGDVVDNHFQVDGGTQSFPKINAIISGIEQLTSIFSNVSRNGFGDPQNNYVWSLAWFKGKLFAGTGRAIQCLSFATSAAQEGNNVYPPPGTDCPADARDIKLAAEIWRYTPETKVWERAYKSPEDIGVQFDARGNATKFTARENGYRGMIVFKEQDGTEALYVAGVSSSSVFEKIPLYQQYGYPPPRIMRSTDGVTFAPIPQAPGSFLGDIVKNSPQDYKVRGFRSFGQLNNKLYVTATDYRGLGYLMEATNPEQGNNAWRQVSPPAAALPIWTIHVFNNQIYVITGDRRVNNGYTVQRTPATGSVPYAFTPIVTGGAFQTVDPLRSPDGLSLEVFKGKLYAGSDRPTELIRINTDDTWDLVVGTPRQTPVGPKAPISGINEYFGNYFNGHFWNMKSYNNQLYLGTWDWSIGLRIISILDGLFQSQYGTDLYSTEDGVIWNFETKTGFGDPHNYGARSFEVTPYGLFLGTARPDGGGEVYLNQSILDFDRDGDIDQADVNVIAQAAAARTPVTGPDDPRDIDRDGVITVNDARKLATRCTNLGCVILPVPLKVAAPKNLTAASSYVVNKQVILQWNAVPGASRYRIYRSENRPILGLFPASLTIPVPNYGNVKVPDDFVNGTFNAYCSVVANQQNIICIVNAIFQDLATTSSFLGLPLPFAPLGDVTTTTFTDPVPGSLQGIYYVVAIDSANRVSLPSNVVGGPSYAAPVSVSTTAKSLSALPSSPIPSRMFANRSLVNGFVERAGKQIASGDMAGARNTLETELSRLEEQAAIDQGVSESLLETRPVVESLLRTLRFVEAGVYPADVLQANPETLLENSTEFRRLAVPR